MRLFLSWLMISWVSVATAAEPEFLIRFSHVTSPSSSKAMGAISFARKAMEFTNGRVRVDVYHQGKLFGDKEEIDALKAGKVEILAPSLSKLGPIGGPGFEMFDLPFLFKGYRDLRKVTMGPIGKTLLSQLEPAGFKGLAYWDNGFKNFSANKPIEKPSDLKGLVMRIQPSDVLTEQIRALGAIPVRTSFAGVYGALESGKVQATESPTSNFFGSKLYEVQSHLTVSEHGYLGYAVLVNKKWWDSLPQDIRTQLERAMMIATQTANQTANIKSEEDLIEMQQRRLVQIRPLKPEERETFRKALLPVHQKMAPVIGPELLEAVYEAIGFKP